MPGGIPLLYGSGTYSEDTYGGDELDQETLMLIREKPPLRTSTEIVTPPGRRYRWAADEPDPANTPGGQRWSDTMPGGYESYNATLPRKPGTDYRDLERLSTVTVTGAGGKVAGEYRLESAPSTSGDQMAVTPAAVGWQAHLEDRKDIRMVYIDQNLANWGPASAERRIALAGMTMSEPQVVPGKESGVPRLSTGHEGVWTTAAFPISEAWYDAKGVDIGQLWYGWTRGEFVSGTANDHQWDAYLTSSDSTVAGDNTGDLQAPGPSTGNVLAATVDGETYAVARLFWLTSAAGIEGMRFEIFWDSLAVLGKHDLPIQGSISDGTAGLLASDIVRHAVQNWAPQLNIGPDSMQPTTFTIGQMEFREATTCAEIVKQASRFSLTDWAVWDNKTFWYTQIGGQAKRWRARIGPSELEQTGPQTDRLWNQIVVQYQDVDGSTKTVGPPGSGADTEDALLVDADPDNPANRLGITRRDLLTIGISTPSGAISIGNRFLQEARLLDRSGKARAVGHIEDDHGVLHPYWAPRAGDEICFTDAADCSYRRIVRTDKDEATRTVTFDLDAPPEGLQAVLERFGAALVKLGL